jgi:hypothetical protein
MSSSAGLLAGFAFAGLAAINVALALEAPRATHSRRMKDCLMLVHRVGGYLFVTVFSVMDAARKSD